MPTPAARDLDALWNSIVSQEGELAHAHLSLGRRTRPPPPWPAPLELPSVHDDLRVVEQIGEGGMGKVELAEQRCLRREVALKRLRDPAEPGDADALIQEALFTGSLEHPNIVPVHQLGRDAEGRPVLLMKRVSGVEWRELLERDDHPRWEQLPDRLGFHLDVLKHLCNALHFAHSRGILHRDVKPANVMVGEFGEVYLLDWGLATRLDAERGEGAPIVGTPAYFAPEMVDATLPLSAQTDVYLLGASLHHVLTGSPRHSAGPEGVRSVVLQAYRSEPVAYGPDVPAELAELCNRATHRDPEQRPPSALAFRERLEDFQQHRGSVRTQQRASDALQALRAVLDEDAPDRERLVALFTECRVGFEQALEAWPGNLEARAGLQSCLELRIEHELSERNKGSVEELLLCLPEPRPQLEERLALLRGELQRESHSREQLRSMRADLDVTSAGRVRAALFLTMGLLAGGGLLTTALLVGQGVIELTTSLKLVYQLALPLLFALGVFAARNTLLRATAARRIAACTVLVLASPAIAYVTSIFIRPVITSALASLLETTTLVAMAIAFDKRIAWIALVTAGVTVGCIALPARFLEVQALGTFAAFAIAAAVTRPRAPTR